MKAKNIHNLDTLEREIYRLKTEVKDIEEKLDRNLDHFQENYWAMAMNSFFCKNDDKANGKNSFGKYLFRHEGLNAAVNTIAENIAEKATEGLHNWMSNFFGRNKH